MTVEVAIEEGTMSGANSGCTFTGHKLGICYDTTGHNLFFHATGHKLTIYYDTTGHNLFFHAYRARTYSLPRHNRAQLFLLHSPGTNLEFATTQPGTHYTKRGHQYTLKLQVKLFPLRCQSRRGKKNHFLVLTRQSGSHA